MIVYSAALLTAPPAGVSLDNPRIGYQTWLRTLDPTAVLASSSAAGSSASAPLRSDTAEYWQPLALPATWIVDLGEARTIDYVGIAGHTFGSKHSGVKIETSSDGVTFALFAYELVPADDSPLLFLGTAVTATRLRITLTGGVAPRMSVVYAGAVLAMERPLQGGFSPPNLSRETELYQGLSRGGQILGQSFRRMGVVAQPQFKNLSETWYRTYFDPFVKAARSYPFFFAWQPSNFPQEGAYVWTQQDIRPQYMSGLPLLQVSVPMRGIGNE